MDDLWWGWHQSTIQTMPTTTTTDPMNQQPRRWYRLVRWWIRWWYHDPYDDGTMIPTMMVRWSIQYDDWYDDGTMMVQWLIPWWYDDGTMIMIHTMINTMMVPWSWSIPWSIQWWYNDPYDDGTMMDRMIQDDPYNQPIRPYRVPFLPRQSCPQWQTESSIC